LEQGLERWKLQQSRFSLIYRILVKRRTWCEARFTLRSINSVTGFELAVPGGFIATNAKTAALGGRFG